MTFLGSFKSEFRTFIRTPVTHGVNEIWERVWNEYTTIDITGILLKNAPDQQNNAEWIDFITETYKLYIETNTELNKGDKITDEDREYTVISVDPTFAFWWKKDHKIAILKRNK